MRRVVRYMSVGMGAVLAVATGTAIGGWYWARRSLPSWSGAVAARGARAPVRIVRDGNAVPHVFAESPDDAYFGLGYVHAQDRLWQLELDRRLGAGTLAEVLGPPALEADQLFRTLGLRRAAEANLEQLDAATRATIDAYVRGVNAYLDQGRALPPEFGLLGVTPAPWTAADSVVWLKLMAWRLSSNLASELWRWRLSQRLDSREIAEFFAPYPGDEPILLDNRPARYGELPAGRTGMFSPLATIASGLGSNNWVVDGRSTQSNKPLLANDPHLGLTAPSIWYLAHLSAPGLNVVGATMPSLPGVILGHNDAVAWAFTNTGSDVQDLFLEQLVPGDPSRYVTPDGSAAFELHHELIRIKGEPDQQLEVRVSRHGPVISDVYESAQAVTPRGHVLALQWTALAPDDQTPRFAIEAARARNAEELRQAARYFHAPTQNIVYADTAGAIGFIAAGRVPVRRDAGAAPGLVPVPGWQSNYDWTGYIPFEELPQQRDPASGRIVTANQKIAAPGYPHWLGAEWTEPYRAERIDALLSATPAHTLDSFEKMQLDVQSGVARTLLPLLLERVGPIDARVDARERHWLEALARWDLMLRADAPEPLVFSAWVRELARSIYADELGELFEEAWAERVGFLRNVLVDRDGQSHWCDDVQSPPRETCGERALVALRDALADLVRRYGEDDARWTWGPAHPAHARHFPMTRVPLLRHWFDILVPSSGGTHAVNVGAYDISDSDEPFESVHAAGLRAVYDLGNLSASRFLINTGQSGHPLSAHYRDWAERWASGGLISIPTERGVIDADAADTLVLTPRPE